MPNNRFFCRKNKFLHNLIEESIITRVIYIQKTNLFRNNHFFSYLISFYLSPSKKIIAELSINVSHTYRKEQKYASAYFLAFSPSQVRAYVVVCDDKVESAVT